MWLEAYYMPCKVVILPKLYENILKADLIEQRLNKFGKKQYNAIDILKNIIGPI